MSLKFIIVLLYVVRFNNALLEKCNGKVLKVQLCNLQNDEYNEGITEYNKGVPSWSPGNPMILKSSVTVYKIAEFNEEENTITIDFLLSVIWHDTRLSLESIDPNQSMRWYAVNEFDQTQIFTPTLEISGTKKIVRKRKYGAIDKDYLWYFHPENRMEYRQSLQVVIYCSMDFKHFPFDHHNCDLNFGSAVLSIEVLKMNVTTIDYKNKSLSYGEEMLHIKQSRLPFDITLESLESFEHIQGGSTFSYAGMRIYLTRNDFGVLIGGYYGPTIIFSMLSLVSYSIKADVVST